MSRNKFSNKVAEVIGCSGVLRETPTRELGEGSGKTIRETARGSTVMSY